MVKENIFGTQDKFMKANFLMVSGMVLENCKTQKETFIKAFL